MDPGIVNGLYSYYGLGISPSDGAVYAVGIEYNGSTLVYDWIIRKSTSNDSGSFFTVDSYNGPLSGSDSCNAIAFSSSGIVFAVGTEAQGSPGFAMLVRRSSAGISGTFSNVDVFSASAGSLNEAFGVAVSPFDGAVYVCGYSANSWIVRRSPTGLSGTFITIDTLSSTSTAYSVAVSPFDGAVYVCGYSANSWIVRKSTTGASGTFSTIDTLPFDISTAYSIAVSPFDGAVYVCGTSVLSGSNCLLTRKSSFGTSGTFISVDSPGQQNINKIGKAIAVSSYGTVYSAGSSRSNSEGFVRNGRLSANSASLSPITFAPSIGYVAKEISGSTEEKFDLANISEWPHSSGLFQMKNIVIGTTTSGKVGNSDQSIVQVKHIGSTVKIMWPRQGSADSSVLGYGDLSQGQSIGKLTNILDPGDFIDVTDFDHMSLYCYLQKQTSGTLDDIVIQVERKPLTNIGFTTEQTISYGLSGSFSEGRLRDLQFKKQIDYGDLSIREIGFPIDVPLLNVKQVRISVRHLNGQADDKNANFIVYGRFIKSNANQTET